MIKLLKFLNKLYNKQGGSVAVIVALSMVVLIGFSALVLDLGVSYNETSKLQNALDSAVLAGVSKLPADSINSSDWTTAQNEAITYAECNGFTLTAADLTPIYQDDIASNKIIGIKATRSIVVEYNFARVLGVYSDTLTRTASAGLTPADGVTGAIPLCISADSLRSAIESDMVTNLTIKCCTNSGDIGIDATGTNGWFGAIRIDGSGASNYCDLLANGYSGILKVGQVLDMESGNMSGPTLDGFTARVSKCTSGCTSASYEPGCPRLVYVPIIEVLPSKQVRIVAFGTFFIESCGGSGNNSYIKATYIPEATVPNAGSGAGGQDFGVYVSKLFE